MRTGVNSIKQRHYQGFTTLRRGSGFTIVELLVVIVVIGILAAITIVSYNGISQKATVASLTSDLDNASKLLKLDQVVSNSGYYPIDLNLANSGKGISFSPGTTPGYAVNNNVSPQTFCISALKNSISYKITNDSSPVVGDCLDFSLVLHLDAGNTASYSGTGTTWTDLSGNGNNGTLVNGVGYINPNINPGDASLVFDGLNDRVDTNIQTFGNNMTWSAWINCTQSMNNYNMFMGRYLPYFAFRSDNKIIFSNSISSLQRSVVAVSSLSFNTWYFVTFTTEYNGTSTLMKLYINGVLDSSSTFVGAQSNSNDKFAVGDGYGGIWYPFKGMVPDVKIYNRTLPIAEIQQNFDAMRGRYGL